AVEHPQPRLLARHRDHLARAPGDGHVGDERRRRHVVIPDRMVHELEGPLLLAGREIDADQALAVQVVARALAAVIIRGRRLDRQVYEPEFLVDADLGPHAGVAVDRPRVVQPGVVAFFTGPGNRVKRPDQLAGARVEGAGQPLAVVAGPDGHSFLHRRTDEDGVADDGRRGVEADLPGLQIDRLAVAVDDADLEIDDAVLAEALHRHAGLRVERDHAVAGSH